VRDVGIQPKGKRPWSVAEAVREQIRSERGRNRSAIENDSCDPIL
jgi:hypothetical protein